MTAPAKTILDRFIDWPWPLRMVIGALLSPLGFVIGPVLIFVIACYAENTPVETEGTDDE